MATRCPECSTVFERPASGPTICPGCGFDGKRRPATGQETPGFAGASAYGPPGSFQGQPQTSQLAIWSLVTSLLGCCIVGIPGSIAAIILGAMARTRIRESNGALTGKGMADWGFWLGIVGTVLFVVGIIVYILVLGAAIGSECWANPDNC